MECLILEIRIHEYDLKGNLNSLWSLESRARTEDNGRWPVSRARVHRVCRGAGHQADPLPSGRPEVLQRRSLEGSSVLIELAKRSPPHDRDPRPGRARRLIGAWALVASTGDRDVLARATPRGVSI